MNNPKPIRRHSNLRRVLMNAGYCGGRSLRGSIWLVFFVSTCIACVINLLGIFALIYVFSNLLTGSFLSWGESVKDTVGASLFFACVLFGDCILYHIHETYYDLPQGHFLNPLPPEPNVILPDAEILVRASAPADSATLLRAATGKQTDDAPAVLLRAVNSETAE